MCPFEAILSDYSFFILYFFLILAKSAAKLYDWGHDVVLVLNGSGGVRAVSAQVSPKQKEKKCEFCCLYVAQASSLMRFTLPPSCSCSLAALMRRSAGLMLAVATVPPPLPPPPPPPPPVSSRSLPSNELALLLTLSAGERPVGGSRQSREPGYWGGAVSMAPPPAVAVETGVEEDGGGQGVLLSRPGDTGSDLMFTLELVFTVSMAP